MIVGLDVGSTSIKAVAVDRDGSILASERVYGRPPAAEAEPEAVWDRVAWVLATLSETVGAPDAVALSAAMHSLVAVAADGTVIESSSWMDEASAEGIGSSLREEMASLYPVTGCPPWPVYLPWRLRLAGPAAGPGGKVGTFKEWLFHRLTGKWWIDHLTASTTGLFDLEGGEWSRPALELAAARPESLPTVVSPTAWAELDSGAAASAGLPPGTPVVVGGPDGTLVHLALQAQRPGSATLSVGTTAALRVVVSVPTVHPEARTWCYRLHPEGYLAGVALNNGGLVLDWARRLLYPDLAPSDGLANVLSAAEEGGDRTMPRLQPFLVPERDPARSREGALTGLHADHGRGEVARAAVTGLVSALADAWRLLEEVTSPAAVIDTVGLPALHPALARALAVGLGRTLRVVDLPDASAVGAAILGYEGITGSAPRIRAEAREVRPSSDA